MHPPPPDHVRQADRARTSVPFTSVRRGLRVTYTDTSSTPCTARHWQWGDGHTHTTTEAVAAHTYPHAGRYTCTLTHVGGQGEGEPATRTINL